MCIALFRGLEPPT